MTCVRKSMLVLSAIGICSIFTSLMISREVKICSKLICSTLLWQKKKEKKTISIISKMNNSNESITPPAYSHQWQHYVEKMKNAESKAFVFNLFILPRFVLLFCLFSSIFFSSVRVVVVFFFLVFSAIVTFGCYLSNTWTFSFRPFDHVRFALEMFAVQIM